MSEPGKGSVTRPKNDGTLVFDNPGQEDAYTVRGDTSAFGGSTTSRPMDGGGAPIWTDGRSTDGNATNSLGGFGGEADSDPMFDRFKHEDEGEGGGFSDIDGNKETSSTNVADSVSSSSLDGAKSDPEFERYPNASSQEDVGSK